METKTRYYCAAEGCSADTKKIGRYGYMENITFHPFPTQKKDPKGRKMWLKLLKRKDYDPPKHHRLCSRHFVEGKPTHENPYPTLFSYNNFKEPLKSRRTDSIDKRNSTSGNFEESSIKVTCAFTSQSDGYELHASSSETYTSFSRMDIDFQTPPVVNEEVVLAVSDSVSESAEMQYSGMPDHDYLATSSQITRETADIGVQTDLGMEEMTELLGLKTKSQNPDAVIRELFVQKVTSSDRNVKQYTGVPSKSILDGLFCVLDEASPNLKYWSGQGSAEEPNYQQNTQLKKSGPARKLSKFEEFILTLVRLRLAIFTFTLADIFGVSNARVSQIFTTWINLMYHVFTPLLIWPSTPVIKKSLPKSFKCTYPNTVCIIDCTEFFIQKPRSPTAQSRTFSSYKHHNTYKALIGIMPSGAIIFVSNLWGGNTSDRYITKFSGFPDFVKPGHEIMADRSFLIRDLLLEKRAKLMIPSFTKKCNWGKGKRLLLSDIIKTRSIEHLRIHVERAIERLTNFHILSNTMPLTLKSLSNQMLKVCAFLCNLQMPLVKK